LPHLPEKAEMNFAVLSSIQSAIGNISVNTSILPPRTHSPPGKSTNRVENTFTSLLEQLNASSLPKINKSQKNSNNVVQSKPPTPPQSSISQQQLDDSRPPFTDTSSQSQEIIYDPNGMSMLLSDLFIDFFSNCLQQVRQCNQGGNLRASGIHELLSFLLCLF
jgi:hypothetical protein